ncbi:MAG: hypothetical protein EP321_08780 [Sphingomonadales bacterium]|nr:MAG: hypothetical protein EP345_14775 [Sphingomonadales bacterium]TNF03953.1 MAG: hypothetical protein EP321_08780 [Sphingomonadales bacterium]
MHNSDGMQRAACRETGLLIFKDYCYALRRDDGVELWLEMDRIPCHLTEHYVRIEGKLYGSDLVSVDRIGPA